MQLEIRHLRHFNDELKRDVITDMMTTRNGAGDQQVLNAVIEFGNAFLELEQAKPSNASAVIWFDVHFGNPALVGMTWAFNPEAPLDAHYEEQFFWRMWTEIGEDTPEVVSLTRLREEFAAYSLQHLTG